MYVAGLSPDRDHGLVVTAAFSNHDGREANVLFVDGHVEFVTAEAYRERFGGAP